MLRRSLYPLASLSLLFALWVGLSAAIFDHHYAEKIPWHSHIYLDLGAVAQHTHETGVGPHQHSPDGSGGAAQDAVSITSTKASSSFWVMVTLGLAMVLSLPLVMPHVFTTSLTYAANARLRSLSVPPLLRPPPASLPS